MSPFRKLRAARASGSPFGRGAECLGWWGWECGSNEMVEELTRLMKERYLAGEDRDLDYASIDDNAALDAYWAKEIQQDAEDAYFDDMED